MYNIIMIVLVLVGVILFGTGLVLVLKRQSAKLQKTEDDFGDSFGDLDVMQAKEQVPKPKKKPKKKKGKTDAFVDAFEDDWGQTEEDDRFTAVEGNQREASPQDIFKSNSATSLFRTSKSEDVGGPIVGHIPEPLIRDEGGPDAVGLLKSALEHVSNNDFNSLEKVMDTGLLNMYKGRQRDYEANGIRRVTSIVSLMQQEVVAVQEESSQIYSTIIADVKVSDYILDVKTKEIVGGDKLVVIPVRYNIVVREDMQTATKVLYSVKLV